jgi:hypothetical protein
MPAPMKRAAHGGDDRARHAGADGTGGVRPKDIPRDPVGGAGARRRSILGRPLVAGVIGFVAGVAFWHFVGFWSFVSAVVFKPDGERTVVVNADTPAGTRAQARPGSDKPATTLHGVLPAASPPTEAARCATLRRDRASAHTTIETCRETPGARIAREPKIGTPTSTAQRGDFGRAVRGSAPAVAGWSATADAPGRARGADMADSPEGRIEEADAAPVPRVPAQ